MGNITKIEEKNRNYLKNTKPLAYKKVMNYEKQLYRGKSIAMLQIQPSYVCNFHCGHCSIDTFRKEKRETITLGDIEILCNNAHEYGLAQIDLTGGEPLAMKNLDDILCVIGTDRFYLAIATNGWFLDKDKAQWLKSRKADRILLSLDSLNEDEHDSFRNKPGSWKRAVSAIKYSINAGLDVKINSVITHQRARSSEFREFLTFIRDKGARLEALPARLAGKWEGKTDLLLTEDDKKFLLHHYDIQFHTSSHYGMDLGCLAVKKIITVTAFGDVIPCIWMYASLGNITKTPFKDIMAKGMRYFGKYHKLCRLSEDKVFLKRYNKSIKGKELPIKIEDVM